MITFPHPISAREMDPYERTAGCHHLNGGIEKRTHFSALQAAGLRLFAIVLFITCIDTTRAQTVHSWGWGSEYDGQTKVPAGLTEVIAIAAGGEHTLALKADGTVTSWG